MLDQKWYLRNRLMLFILSIILASCNFPSLSTSNNTTQEVPEDPTSPPIQTQMPVIEPTSSPTEESLTEPSPTATIAPPPELPGHCRPFPDQIFPALTDGWFQDTLWVKCGGSSEPHTVRAPVEGLYWDYSNATGKVVYGLEYTSSPEDLNVWIGDYSLWVYDYRTDMSTLWIKGGVLEAKWAPEVEGSGIQQLAVLLGDGTVAMVTGPEQVEALVNIDRYDLEMDACCITWSPKADKLAYVKNETLYVVPTTPQEPRKMAENAFGNPVWVKDQQLLLFPSSVIKVAAVDGSGPFIPNIPDGNRIWTMPENTILWDPEGKVLVFDEIHITGSQEVSTWVYSYSEDFETVIEIYSFVRQDTSDLLGWYDQGERIFTSNGEVISVRPSENRITVEGIIDRLYQGRYMLWLEGDPYPVISVSLRALIEDANGNRASILDLDAGMKLRIEGKIIAQGNGFMAEKIQILEDE